MWKKCDLYPCILFLSYHPFFPLSFSAASLLFSKWISSFECPIDLLRSHWLCETLFLISSSPCLVISPGCKQRCGVTQWQAAGLGLPGPDRQAVVAGGRGKCGPAGGVSGPPSWRLGRLLLSRRPGAGHVLCRWHHQALEPARLQLPQGGPQGWMWICHKVLFITDFFDSEVEIMWFYFVFCL